MSAAHGVTLRDDGSNCGLTGGSQRCVERPALRPRPEADGHYAIGNFAVAGCASAGEGPVVAGSAVECLVRMNIGIFRLDVPDFLSWANLRSIADLSLPATRKNNIELKYLSSYRNLVKLFLGGHVRNLDTIGTLLQLTDLSLNLAAAASLTFLNGLPNLRSLRFILGGRANLDEIATHPLE